MSYEEEFEENICKKCGVMADGFCIHKDTHYHKYILDRLKTAEEKIKEILFALEETNEIISHVLDIHNCFELELNFIGRYTENSKLIENIKELGKEK